MFAWCVVTEKASVYFYTGQLAVFLNIKIDGIFNFHVRVHIDAKSKD